MGKQRVAKESLHLRLDAATMERLAREMEYMRGNTQLMSVLGGDELTLTLVARAMVRRGLDAMEQDRLLANLPSMPGPSRGTQPVHHAAMKELAEGWPAGPTPPSADVPAEGSDAAHDLDSPEPLDPE